MLYHVICHLIGGRWAWLRLWPWHDDSVSDHAVADYVGDVKALADA